MAKRPSEVRIKVTHHTIERAVKNVIATHYSIDTMTAAVKHLVEVGAEKYINIDLPKRLTQ